MGYLNTGDSTKQPYSADTYADTRGVVDLGNLFQFAPYEKGYCMLFVINGPYFMEPPSTMNITDSRRELQKAFIRILEQEFKGLDGIESLATQQMTINVDNISQLSLIGSVELDTQSSISMRFTEKSGTLIYKYLDMYLRYLRDPRTKARTYGGLAVAQGSNESTGMIPSFDKEVFNMLYVVTDSTMLNVEKAFLLLNAQPTEAPRSDLFNIEKGSVDVVEININFNCFVADGVKVNEIAKTVISELIDNSITQSDDNKKIKINSYGMDWSYSVGGTDKSKKTSSIKSSELVK